jgi:AraC-like DNA-binding protein
MVDRALYLSCRYQPFVLCGSNAIGRRSFKRESVPWYRLVYAEDGALIVDSHTTAVAQRIDSPCGVLQPPGNRYRVRASEGARCRIIEFDVIAQRRIARNDRHALIHASSRPQPQPEAVWGRAVPLVIPAPHLAGLRAVMFYCGDQWWRSGLGRARANGRLAEWLATFVEMYEGTGLEPEDWLSHAKHLAAHYMYQGLRVTKWADLIGMGRQHFTKRFTREAGESPGHYLARLRMEEAQKLLLSGGLTVKEVARLCGFESLNTFSRFFRTATEETPSAWRARRLSRRLPHMLPD